MLAPQHRKSRLRQEDLLIVHVAGCLANDKAARCISYISTHSDQMQGTPATIHLET